MEGDMVFLLGFAAVLHFDARKLRAVAPVIMPRCDCVNPKNTAANNLGYVKAWDEAGPCATMMPYSAVRMTPHRSVVSLQKPNTSTITCRTAHAASGHLSQVLCFIVLLFITKAPA